MFPCLSFWILHFLLWGFVKSQLQYPLILPSSCTDPQQFFNTANQQCVSCASGDQQLVSQQQTTNFMSCTCATGYKRVVPSASESFPFDCESCSSGITTTDGKDCIAGSCQTPAAEVGGVCSCSETQQYLLERNSTGSVLTNATCVQCSASTAPSTSPGRCVGCDTCSSLCNVQDGVCFGTTLLPNLVTDSLFIANKGRAAFAGCQRRNITACQVLVNMCVMEVYNIPSSAQTTACSLYGQLANSRNPIDQQHISWYENLPWLYYDIIATISALNQPNTIASTILSSTAIPTAFSFTTSSVLNLVVFKYDANGTFLGSEQAATTGVLQLCPDRPSMKSQAFLFGTSYTSSCFLSALDLSNSALYPTVFYEANLQFTDSSGVVQLYPVPALVTNYENIVGNAVNQQASNANWVFVRRFVLVDNLVGVTSSSSPAPASVRYPSTMSLRIRLQSPTGSGLIYPPYLSITYATVATPSSAENDVQVTTNFNVEYAMDEGAQVQGITVALSVLGALSALYTFVEIGSWRRRQGLEYIDGTTLLMFVYMAMSNLANVFFIVLVGYASVTLFFFKGQSTVTSVLPGPVMSQNFTTFLAIAFAFKAVEVLVIIYRQANIDIFLIDWERPKTKDPNGKVSIWRTYFIANEWNEIQTHRKTSFTFQLMAVLLFLEVVGFKSLALENPNTGLNQESTTSAGVYIPVYNTVLRFALASLIFIVLALVQIIYNIAIHERFIHDKIREFVDLCSVSNVSIFILSDLHFGYYIHGRSVYGNADTDMHHMNLMLQKEEENLTGARGLEAGREEQTFEIAIPVMFRMHIDRIYQALEATKNQPSTNRATGVNASSLPTEMQVKESVQAYSKMREFLTSFLEHSIRDLDYLVKDKMFLEKVMDMEFQEPINGAYFYNDNGNSFTNVLFYGREFALLSFDILLFNIIDFGTQNFVLAAILTYVIGKFLAAVRQSIGRHYLARKTLVDKRFLI